MRIYEKYCNHRDTENTKGHRGKNNYVLHMRLLQKTFGRGSRLSLDQIHLFYDLSNI